MGLVEHIAGEVAEEFPDFGGFLLGAAEVGGGGAELLAELFDAVAVAVFDERAAEQVGAAPGHAGEAVGDEQDVFLEGHQTVGVGQQGFQ